MKKNNIRHCGFTLLELSIVLIIIGFLAGGIVLAKALIRDAKIHNMLAEYDAYVKAIQEFQDKYQALPGDMKNATSLWGAATACPNNNPATPLQMPTCNGDGNGHIGDSDSNATLTNSNEWWQAWQHLANAGLIDGRFNGAAAQVASPQLASIGTNAPASRLRPGGWTLLYYAFTNATPAATWADRYGHILSFGSTAYSFTNGPVLSVSEAAGIDQKIDDGKPGLGNVRAWISSTCVNGTVQKTATYILESSNTSQAACSLFFIPGF